MKSLVSPHIKVSFLILLLLSLSFLAHAEEPVFQFVRAIGDERENYFFTETGSITISDEKDIFIMNKKNFSLRKFNWNGTFIDQTGRRGQGPGDFITPSVVQYHDRRLYIYDWLNHRIAILSLVPAHVGYIKTNNLRDNFGGIYSMFGSPIILDDNLFLGVNIEYSPEKGSLFLFDKKQNVHTSFFCALPTDLEDEMWRLKADKEKRSFFSIFTYPIVGVNHKKKQMLVSFMYPDTDIRFYLYSFSGELIRRFSYRQDEKFRFPLQQLDDIMNSPAQSTMLLDILFCKDYYLVFVAQTVNRKRPDQKTIFTYLFINEQGEIVHQKEERVRYKATTPDGYLAGILWDRENDLLKFIISKLNTARLAKMKPISSRGHGPLLLLSQRHFAWRRTLCRMPRAIAIKPHCVGGPAPTL